MSLDPPSWEGAFTTTWELMDRKVSKETGGDVDPLPHMTTLLPDGMTASLQSSQ